MRYHPNPLPQQRQQRVPQPKHFSLILRKKLEMKIPTNYSWMRVGGKCIDTSRRASFAQLLLHKLLNFNDATDSYRRQNRSRGDKLRRSARAGLIPP